MKIENQKLLRTCFLQMTGTLWGLTVFTWLINKQLAMQKIYMRQVFSST